MNSTEYYCDMKQSLDIKKLAAEAAKSQARRFVDEVIKDRLSYSSNIDTLLEDDGKIQGLNMHSEDGFPGIYYMLPDAFGCTAEELGDILTKRLQILVKNLRVKCPNNIHELYIDTSGYTPKFKRRTDAPEHSL